MAAPLKVLVIEDSEDDALLAIRELRRLGRPLDWVRVESGPALETELDRRAWDLVLADYSLPGFSGRAALETVRGRGLETPFLFVSGTIGEDVAVAAMRAGANDYVIKGDLKRLIPAVERELREADRRQERQVAREQLRVAEDRFRKSFAASPVGISISTLSEGRYVDVNPALLALLGYGREEMIGHTATELGVWIEASQRDGTIEELCRNGPVLGRDLVFRTRSGERRPVLASFERIELGGEDCLLAFVLDLTERKELEQQLLHSQRLEAVGRLAGGVAHDFNNLLAVILGFCDLLIEEGGEGAEPSAELGQIRRAAEDAAKLTRQLLAFGRKQVLRPRRLDLAEAVSRSVGLLARLLGGRVEIVLEGAPVGAAIVLADPVQLDQVLVNLVVNARDAMPDGGRLTVRTALVEVESEAAGRIPGGRAGRFVELSVRDTGVGMEPETRAHLFEPFFTTKPPGQGTGLGLATVWGIVAQSGGFVAVDSEPGRGTDVRVCLPWIEGVAEPEVEPTPTRASERGRETILLVDDEPAVRQMTARLLEARGYRVLEAGSGEEALAFVAGAASAPDLLLSDLAMPGMTGPELVDRFRAIRPGMPFLYFSGYTSDAALREGLVKSAGLLLEKPFTGAALAARVREALDARQREES